MEIQKAEPEVLDDEVDPQLDELLGLYLYEKIQIPGKIYVKAICKLLEKM
jgi:hypothetical protein